MYVHDIYNKLNTAWYSTMIRYGLWVCLVVCIGAYNNIFSHNMIRFGPPRHDSDSDRQLLFFGGEITSWKTVYLVILYCFAI
jgi:hypothetical protein